MDGYKEMIDYNQSQTENEQYTGQWAGGAEIW